MTPEINKQNLALVSLFGAIANAAVAFGFADATLAAMLQGAGYGLASAILYLLHLKDKTGA